MGLYYPRSGDKIVLGLTNESEIPENIGHVYTSIQLFFDDGSPLTEETCACFTLPDYQADTSFYSLELDASVPNTFFLPDSFNFTLKTKFPDCSLDSKKIIPTNPNLPTTTDVACSDYEIVGIYNHFNASEAALLMIRFQNEEANGRETGYTSFTFISNDGDTLLPNSGPHHLLPTYYEDTSIFMLQTNMGLEDKYCGKLHLEFPSCVFDFCELSTSIFQPTSNAAFTIYPNPTMEKIFIIGPTMERKSIIYNAEGMEVMQSTDDEINLTILTSGTYFIKIITKSKIETHKFIKT